MYVLLTPLQLRNHRGRAVVRSNGRKANAHSKMLHGCPWSIAVLRCKPLLGLVGHLEMSGAAAAAEIEETSPSGAALPTAHKSNTSEPGLCKKVIYVHDRANAASREKIDVKRKPHTSSEHSGGSHGRELIRILRESDQKCNSMAEHSSLCKAMPKKLKRILLSYARQWIRGFHFRIIFASHLVFWMSLLPALAFGSWLQHETKGGIGITEVLLSTCFCGLVIGILGTQPLAIVGVSVPSLVFMVATSHTAKRLSLDFVPWLAWIGLWCSLLLVFLAASGACRLAAHLTFFSWEIVRLFVGMSLLWIGTQEIVRFFSEDRSVESSLLSLWLATCTFVLSIALTGAQSWHCLNGQARELIHNYGPALAFLVFTVLPLLPKFQHIQFQRVDMPDYLYRSDNFTKLGTLVKIRSVPLWAILLAFIPGAFLATMIFVDHNAASVVLKKSPSSWDLFIVALLSCICSLFGMPFCYGLSTQSLAHRRALIFHTSTYDEEGQQKSKETVRAQRVSPIVVSMLCGLPLVPGIVLLLEKIPIGVIAGLFLEMAYSCLRDLKAVRRLRVFFTISDSDNGSSMCAKRIYCKIQFACALVIFTASRTPAALLFPLFILLVIWLRHYLLLSIFSTGNLGNLDSSLSSSTTADKSLVDVPKNDVPLQTGLALVRSRAAHIEIESSSSSQSRGSPSMLIMASTRRLKERSRRRNKRKRQGSAPRVEDDHPEAARQKQRCCAQASSFDADQRHINPYFEHAPVKEKLVESESKDTLGMFGRSKRRAVTEDPIEIHSNLLYDHGWQSSQALLRHQPEESCRPSPASNHSNGASIISECNYTTSV